MREHQIIITLKPEQFLEVQRLARLAGAKSMGIFVRQSLLAALGIDGSNLDGSKPPAPALTAGLDVSRTIADLRRLHAELKAFVAESLANTYTEPPAASAPQPNEGLSGAAIDLTPGSAAPQASGDTAIDKVTAEFSQSEDELEQIAREAFAISPRLGAMESLNEPPAQSEEQPTTKQDDDNLPGDPLTELLQGASSSRAEKNIEDDETIDVPLPQIASKPDALQPPPAPAPSVQEDRPVRRGLSGGPPPRRRQ